MTGSDYQNACRMIKCDEEKINAVAASCQIPQGLIQSIVFPEYIRYHAVQGLLEEKSLEFMYVAAGSDQVDFSIGKFQMKPGFAEDIETRINKNDFLSKKYKPLVEIKTNGKELRAIRVARLKSVYWQSLYVAAFVDLCSAAYNLDDYNLDEKIKFIATVYNCGWKSETEIKRQFDYPHFPYGKKAPQGVNYWEVAIDYHLKSKRNA
jgi:hypothetical protein